MTVSSELFHPTTYAAATGSSRDSASIDKSKSQGTDNISEENSASGFRGHLAQAIENPTSADTQTSANNPSFSNQVSIAAVTIAKTEHNEAASGEQKPALEIIQKTGNEDITGHIIAEQIITDTDHSALQVAGAGKSPEPVPQVVTENQMSNNGGQQSEKADKPEKLVGEKSVAQTGLSRHTSTREGIKSEQSSPAQNVQATTTTKKKNQTSPAVNINSAPSSRPTTHGQIVQEIARIDTPETHGQIVQEIARSNSPETPAPTIFQTENTEAQKAPALIPVQAEVSTISPDLTETLESSSPVSDSQHIAQAEKMQPHSNLAQAQDGKTAPQIDMVQADVERTPVSSAPLDVVKVPATPDQQAAARYEILEQQAVTPLQQIAAATSAPSLQVEAETNKTNKDSVKKSVNPSDKIKGASQIYSETKTTVLAGQSKTSAPGSNTNSGHLPAPKVPLVAELSQSIATTESKTTGIGTLQLPTGLLVAQEVGQSSPQANTLTSTHQVTSSLPPVTPQMVTKQISMAITKQAGNGEQSFKISLKPAHLGQVDIRMDFQADGRITATVTVENDRTLALLQKDQGSLEKALENAGFNAGGNGLNFSLKRQQQNQGHSDFADNGTESGESDHMSSLQGSIISHQQMKMAYSDNVLDINI